MDGAVSFSHQGNGAVGRQRDEGEYCDRNRIPVEDADVTAHAEIREEREGETAMGVKRDTAHDVAEGGADEDGEQDVGGDEAEMPAGAPERVVAVTADFMGHAAQHERPEQEKKGQVEPGEGGGQDRRESDEEGSAESDEPDFVPAPERADGAEDQSAFCVRFADGVLQHSRADGEAVENDEHHEHEREDGIPDFNHARLPGREGFHGRP